MALASLAGGACLAGFLSTMSPLEALTSPFRPLVSVRDVPERLRMVADATTVDRDALADGLRRLAASEHLVDDVEDAGPRDPRFVEASLTDGNGNRLSLMKTAGHYDARVLPSRAGPGGAEHLAASVRAVLLPLGFKAATR